MAVSCAFPARHEAELMPFSEHYHRAIALFDAANAADPNREAVDGVRLPKELVYARRMTACLERQHIRRWTVSRKDYAVGREGYRRWRTDLARFHALTAAGILREVGYGEETVARVESLIRKERLKLSAETQLLEDVICLVFLEYYLEGFAPKHDDTKLLGVLRKTWRKMSESGQRAALQLGLPVTVRSLVDRALANVDHPGL